MTNLVRSKFQAHPFHLVSPSPWPVYTSFALLVLTTSAASTMHSFPYAGYVLTAGFILVPYSMGLWWRDVISEVTYLGNHTLAVQKGLNIGVALFILSEALFFLGIFWAFFHSALSPTVELGAQWPPMGIEAINPFELPLLNTVILLSSGVTVTYAHHSLIQGNRSGALYGLVATVVLAVVFTIFQGVEYTVSSFTISDGAFGTCFYFGTGFILTLGPLLYFIPRLHSYTKKINSLSNNFSTKSYKSKLQAYWVTGFSDAESSFIIRIAKDKSRLFGIRVLPIFSIELHIRDIEVLHKIRDFFNVGSVIIRNREGKSTGIYSVQSVKDLTNVIIPHFLNYPLITQKQADFILFLKVVNLINSKEHLTEKGIHEILSIRASMNKGLTANLKALFPNVVGVERPIISNQIIKSPLWLIGFVDGEGSFYLKITKLHKISLVFSITQHSRDSDLFNVIKDYLGCGVVEKPITRPNEVHLVVYSLEDLVSKVIPIFENALVTQKYFDFIYFKEVSILMLNKEHLTEEGIKKILSIKELKQSK
uniref:Cytochrome c oxidase subunit 3 n=1 Tax=Scytalidium sp. TaxID=1715249 RepID=A0A513U0V9_9PEZI|nr:cytochrome c oxidase subunit 3 [Scytalidium sp.]